MTNIIDVYYDDDAYQVLAPEEFVLGFLDKVLERVGLSNVEFSVTFATEEHIHQLNKEYRDIDDSTDILSFAAEDEDPDGTPFFVGEEEARVLGDMIICPEVLASNAQTFGVDKQEELKRLLIHGVLHLSGENHSTNDASEPMLIHQEEILKALM